MKIDNFLIELFSIETCCEKKYQSFLKNKQYKFLIETNHRYHQNSIQIGYRSPYFNHIHVIILLQLIKTLQMYLFSEGNQSSSLNPSIPFYFINTSFRYSNNTQK